MSSKRNLYIGFDVGSTTVKAIVFDFYKRINIDIFDETKIIFK